MENMLQKKYGARKICYLVLESINIDNQGFGD